MQKSAASALFFVITACSGYLIFYGQGRILIFIASLVAALSLYILREIARKFYGFLEIIFSSIALWDSSNKGRGAFSSGFSDDFQSFQWVLILLQTGGAIYVLIRGLDNLAFGAFLKDVAKP